MRLIRGISLDFRTPLELDAVIAPAVEAGFDTLFGVIESEADGPAVERIASCADAATRHGLETVAYVADGSRGLACLSDEEETHRKIEDVRRLSVTGASGIVFRGFSTKCYWCERCAATLESATGLALPPQVIGNSEEAAKWYYPDPMVHGFDNPYSRGTRIQDVLKVVEWMGDGLERAASRIGAAAADCRPPIPPGIIPGGMGGCRLGLVGLNPIALAVLDAFSRTCVPIVVPLANTFITAEELELYIRKLPFEGLTREWTNLVATSAYYHSPEEIARIILKAGIEGRYGIIVWAAGGLGLSFGRLEDMTTEHCASIRRAFDILRAYEEECEETEGARGLYWTRRSEIRGRRSEVGSQRSEVGSQRSEVRHQTSDIGHRIKGISSALWDSHTPVFLSRMGEASPETLPKQKQFQILAERIAALGLNAAFLHCFTPRGGLRDQDDIGVMFAACKAAGVAPIAYGPGLILNENPGHRSAVNRVGESPDARLICPNDETYVRGLIEDSRKLTALGAAGVMHDFLRYEKNDDRYPPVEYCFCEVCLEKFQSDAGVEIPATYSTTGEKADHVLGISGPIDQGVFIRWRARQITDLAARLAGAIHAENPDCAAGNFAYAGPHSQNMLRVGHDLTGLAEAFSEGGRYPAILGPMAYGMPPYDLLFRARYYRQQTKGLARAVWAITPLMNTLEEMALQVKMAALGGADGFFIWALRFLHPEHYERWASFRKAMEQMDHIGV